MEMPGGHSPAPQTVLIETLWNVNSVSALFLRQILPVLIETLWNVNTGYTAYIKDGEMY